MNLTVCINNHNYGRYLKAAVESALGQTAASEVIVVDDGSSDISHAVAGEFATEPRVRFLSTENRGQLAALIAGIESSRTEYLCFLDADDRLRPNHIEILGTAFASHTQCGIAWTRHENSDGSPREADGFPHGMIGPGAMLTQLTWNKPRTITSCLGIRRRNFEFLSSLPAHILRQWMVRADDCILIAGALSGAMRYAAPEVTVDRTVHDCNRFFNNPAARTPFERYRHTYATAVFVNWVRRTLDIPEPNLPLLLIRHSNT